MLADRLKTLAPASTLAVQAKARELRARGVDVISFGAGEPDFDTPDRIKDAAVQAMRRGQTKYTEVGGIPELRAAVCAKLKRDQGLDYTPAEILVSCGAKHTLYNIATALLNPGDEVVVPSPFWVSYPEQARLLDAVPVPVETREASGFDLDPARVRDAITPRTKLIVLNSPNNPTGAVFSRAALETVARLAVEHGLWLVSDECYESLTFDGRHVSIASLGPEVKARTLVVNTCSKAYAMTGWRIGYAAGPRDVIRAMTDVQSQVTSNPSSIAQWAAVEALSGPQDDVAKMAGEFDRRRRLIIAGLNALLGVSRGSRDAPRSGARGGGGGTRHADSRHQRHRQDVARRAPGRSARCARRPRGRRGCRRRAVGDRPTDHRRSRPGDGRARAACGRRGARTRVRRRHLAGALHP